MSEIPQSSALAEAKPTSLTEYLSRDPNDFKREDRNAIVAALREQRAKWEAAEASGAKTKGVKVKALPGPVMGSPDDLGL